MTTQTDRANELWFTRGTKRYERIGDTMRVVTEGAIVTIQLGDITRVSVVVTDPSVIVNKSTRKSATATENKPAAAPEATAVKPARKPAAARPAARTRTTRKPAA